MTLWTLKVLPLHRISKSLSSPDLRNLHTVLVRFGCLEKKGVGGSYLEKSTMIVEIRFSEEFSLGGFLRKLASSKLRNRDRWDERWCGKEKEEASTMPYLYSSSKNSHPSPHPEQEHCPRSQCLLSSNPNIPSRVTKRTRNKASQTVTVFFVSDCKPRPECELPTMLDFQRLGCSLPQMSILIAVKLGSRFEKTQTHIYNR